MSLIRNLGSDLHFNETKNSTAPNAEEGFVMTLLTSYILTLTLAIAIIMAPRIYTNWLRLKEYAEEGDLEKLGELLNEENNWVARHLFCAVCGLVLVALTKYLPSMDAPEQLIKMTAIYSMLSFLLAFIESILSHKISILNIAQMEPAKEQTKE